MSNSRKFIVITSIFEATQAVKKFSDIPGWQLIVVGDKKTPPNWEYKDVIYLGPDDQEKLNFQITKHLPWDHYCRKMVGYLYAMRSGADIIFDTDDDNEPKESWPSLPEPGEPIKVLSGQKFINVYKYFTNEFVWPRGYPLSLVLSDQEINSSKTSSSVGVWQFLADEDPDVDAIYRLTNDKPIYFDENEPIILANGTACPFNSQNTAFIKEVFPLLYLPAFVTFRFTDILRGLVAQPILWENGYQLGFGPATVIQKRNPHDYMRDFESEIPVYLHSEEVIDLVRATLSAGPNDLLEQLRLSYKRLGEKSIVTDKENVLLDAWIQDIKSLT